MRITVSILFLFLAISISAQTRTRKTVVTERSNNGVIKRKTVTKVTTNVYIDLFNYYKKTSVKITVYDSITGKKQAYTERITRNGMGGRHCYEMYRCEILYDTKGRKTRFEETWCDKGARNLKEYEHGKMVFHVVERRKPTKIVDE